MVAASDQGVRAKPPETEGVAYMSTDKLRITLYENTKVKFTYVNVTLLEKT
jgi:hypothetical protein